MPKSEGRSPRGRNTPDLSTARVVANAAGWSIRGACGILHSRRDKHGKCIPARSGRWEKKRDRCAEGRQRARNFRRTHRRFHRIVCVTSSMIRQIYPHGQGRPEGEAELERHARGSGIFDTCCRKYTIFIVNTR